MPPSRKRPRLTKDSTTVKRIKAMFHSGELLGTETAQEVYSMDPIFKPFRYEAFKNKFYIIGKKKEEASSVLNPQFSEPQAQFAEAKEEVRDEELDNDLECSQNVSRLPEGQFHHLVLISEWEDPVSTNKRLMGGFCDNQ
ncbi:hypothetical protein FGB62_360g08 [Gracilaria domingensis]|nr:hypothetical protein FGB62_360g08 [Gracilaria domingensis]